MPVDNPLLREGAASPLDYERRMYEQTRNPIHVWRGVQMCCECRDDRDRAAFPNWIVHYLDRFSGVVQDWFANRDGTDAGLADHLAAELRFKPAGRGVRETAFTAWDRVERDRGLVLAIVRSSRARPDVSTTVIIADLAADLGVSESTLWRAWQRRGHE